MADFPAKSRTSESEGEEAGSSRPGRDRRWLVWGGVSLALGAGLAVAPWLAPSPAEDLVSQELAIAGRAGWVLLALAVLLPLLAGRLGLRDDAPPAARCRRFPYPTLFLASFASLFLELMLIRYAGSQIRIFSFYKNVPLVGAFLGLGIGCWLGRGRARSVSTALVTLVPITFFLAYGASILDGTLGRLAAQTSSEQILGDVVNSSVDPAGEWLGQIAMGLFCVATLIGVAAFFVSVGRLLGDAFEAVPRLPGYTTNIVASLVGVLAFVGLSFLWAPPWAWYLVGLAPLLWWLPSVRSGAVCAVLAAISTLAVVPHSGDVVWSSYQKLVGYPVPPGPHGSGNASPGYLVRISDVFYQIAVDLRPETPGNAPRSRFPHYDSAFAGLGPLDRVLIAGAGTGNDVAAALRAGARHVDAVDIDRSIVEMGRLHHPERPYDDPRVEVLVDDARHAFRTLPAGRYDAVVFGLLDSHTQLGISSVRLDNYVFTVESLASARRLLVPGGHLIVTAATFRDWFRVRLLAMLAVTCRNPVEVTGFGSSWMSYRCQVGEPAGPAPPSAADLVLPTDDWPFLYLPSRGVPIAYLVVIVMLALGSWFVLRAEGLALRRFTPFQGHLFFLGAAFLLMEVVAIDRLALLFGTTWIVSAVTISLVPALIVAANTTLAFLPRLSYRTAYLGLVASLLLSYALEPSLVVGFGRGPALLYGVVVLLPIYFAGLVFAQSFRGARNAGPAIGANILGAVLGGWTENATLALGIRAMLLVALVFYLLSLLMLLRAGKGTGGEPATADVPAA